jgi:ketosteroid isomerase-like protein
MCQQPSTHAHDTRQAGRGAEMRHAAAAFPSSPRQWHGQALGSADPAGHWCGAISRKGMTVGQVRIPPAHARLRADPIKGWSRYLWQQGRPGRSLRPVARLPRRHPATVRAMSAAYGPPAVPARALRGCAPAGVARIANRDLVQFMLHVMLRSISLGENHAMRHFRYTAAAAAMALAACQQQAVAPDPAMQNLADRVAIEDLVVGYYAHLGGRDAHAFDTYFTEDAVFDVNGLVANGRDEIAGIYEGLGEDETSAGNGEGPFRMILSNPVITVNGDSATASFIWTGIRNPDIAGPPVFVEQGREYDKLVKVDGQWKFTHRVVIADSGLPASMNGTWQRRADFSVDDL